MFKKNVLIYGAGEAGRQLASIINFSTKMNILGLMAIPPNDNKSEEYFKSISELNASLGLKELSIGMSSDYMKAVEYKTTYLRIGSLIFGDRT